LLEDLSEYNELTKPKVVRLHTMRNSQ